MPTKQYQEGCLAISNKIKRLVRNKLFQAFILITVFASNCRAQININGSYCEGETAMAQVIPGEYVSSYQWQISTDEGNNWNDIPNENSDIYSFLTDREMNGWFLRCALNLESESPIITDYVTINVDLYPGLYPTSSLPQDNVCLGDEFHLEIGSFYPYNNGGGTRYLWYEIDENGEKTWLTDNTDQLSLNVVASETNNRHQFVCEFVNACMNYFDGIGFGTLHLIPPPTIADQPISQHGCLGSSVELYCSTTDGNGAFQWQNSLDNGNSWNDIEGAVNFSYPVELTNDVNNNLFRCVITDQCGNSITSDTARLIADSPFYVIDPDNVKSKLACTGDSITIDLNDRIQGGSNLRYDWIIRSNGPDSTINNATSILNLTLDKNTMVWGMVSNNCNTSAFANYFNLIPEPVLFKQPSSSTICENDTAKFNIETQVDPSDTIFSYQWQSFSELGTWIDIENAVNTNYAIKATETNRNSQYRCLIKNVCGTVIVSDSALLTIPEPPAILASPSSKSVCDGDTTSFQVYTSNANNNYQWQYSSDDGNTWVNIADGKENRYVLNTGIQDNGRKYRCSVSNYCGLKVFSGIANLTVHPLPVISSATVSDTLCENSPLALTVAATDTSGATLSYQWQKYVPNEWQDISGANSYSYNITASADINKSYFRCVVTGLCSSNSTPTQISVNNAPVITSQPANASVCQGTFTSFGINVTGKDSTFQWQVSSDNGNNWNDIVGEQKNYLVAEGSVSNNGNLYRCMINGSCGSQAISDPASLTLITDPVITSQPADQTVTEGDAVTFSVGATGSDLAYTWQSNTNGTWTNIQDANTGIFQKTTSLSDAGAYRCIVNNVCYSRPAELSVAAKPAIIAQPSDQILMDGQVASFSVTAAGYELAYQWQKYEDSTWVDIPTATTKVYKVAVSSAQEGDYRCQVSNSDEVMVVSNSASLRRCTPPVVTEAPADQSVCEGSQASFQVTVSDAVTYQWQVKTGSSNWSNITGATNSTYSFTTQSNANSNVYRCVAQRSCGASVTTAQAVLIVNKTQILSQPVNNALCNAEQAAFSVTASGPGLSYQWQQYNGSWNNINGAVNSSFTQITGTDVHRKYYRCVVNGTCGTATSNSALLTVGPQITNALTDQTSCTGGTATFGSISAIGSGALAYQWQQSSNQGQTWENLNTAVTASYSTPVTDAINGNLYRGIVSSCGFADTSNTAALIVKNTHFDSQPVATSVCEGNATNMNVSVTGIQLSYQWAQSPDGTTWTNIQGATKDSLKIPVLYSMDQQKFICKVKGSCDVNWINSNVATLTAIQNTIAPLSLTARDIICEGGTNSGSIITDAITGGQSPYSYHWSNGSSDKDLSSLATGTYTLTVSDANGCRKTLSKTIAYEAPIIGRMEITDIAIPGTSGGAIDAGISGGHQPLTFEWNDSITLENRVNLKAGTYILTVTDNASCVKTFSATVNEQGAVDYVDIEKLPDPETRELDKTLSVGTIAGEGNVSASGAATYSIPVETLPGIGNLRPQLSVVYSSQGGNGLLGWGCNMAGISAISRTSRNIYLDTTARGLTLSTADGYALDGNRLMLTNGTYGANNSEYGTESESFSTVTAHGDYEGTGPAWFEVKAKNGARYVYGRNPQTRLVYAHRQYTGRGDYIDFAAVLTWNLDSVIDVDGNYITYTYQQDSLVSYLTKISYGGNKNAGTPSRNTVELFYSNRTDAIPVHYGYENGSVNVLLKKISVKHDGILFREYNFTYSLDDYSRLTEISEMAGDGKRYNPTVFKWGEYKTTPVTSLSVSVLNDPDVNITDSYHVNADINGDALTDLIAIYKGKYNVYYARVYYASANSDGSVTFSKGELIELGQNMDATHFNYSTRIGNSSFGDLDADNKIEIVTPKWNNENGSAVDFRIAFDDMKESVRGSMRNIENIRATLSASSEVPVYAISDINNDGFDEIIFIEKDKKDGNLYPGKIYLPISNKWINFNVYQSTVKPESMFTSDFDGDGMQDIVVVDSKGYRIYKNCGGDVTSSFLATDLYNTLFTSNYAINLGDFNGDGLPDFVIKKKGTEEGDWSLMLNKGNMTFKYVPLPNIKAFDDKNTTKDDDKDNCLVYDFNQDGKNDLIVTEAHYRWTSDFWSSWKELDYFDTYWYQSTGEGFELAYNPARSNNKDNAYQKYFITGDFNGDGRTELMNYGYSCLGSGTAQRWRMYGTPNKNNETGVITTVANGLGQTLKFKYHPLSDNAIYAQKGSFEYPLSTFTAPLYVADTLQTQNGSGGYTTLTSSYEDALIQKQGKGFLGFAKTTQVNSATGAKTVTTTNFNTSYFVPSSQKVESFVDSIPISKAANNYIIVPLNGKRIFTYPSKAETWDLLKNIRSVTANSFDNRGNLTTKIDSVNGSFYVRKSAFSDYDNYGNPASVSINSTRAGEPSFTQTQSFIYNDKGKVTSSTANGLTTSVAYDVFGNLDSTTLGTGEGARTSVNGYSDDGRFPDKQINPLGHTISSILNYTGQPLTQTDANGLITSHIYNSWGMLTETYTPDNKAMKQLVDWVKTGETDAPEGALYYTSATMDDLFTESEYFDVLGRSIRKVSTGYKGARFYTDTRYNENGQVMEVSDPYLAGGTKTKINTFSYDGLGRTETETQPNGVTKTYDYNDASNKVTTTLSTGEVYTKTYDATGQVVVATDPGGTITYSYTSAGKPREIESPGSVIEIRYDAYARQDTLVDPNAGTTSYSYNTFGEIATQVDGRGKTITMAYDKLGRVTEKNIAGVTTTYVYDQGVMALGTTSSISRSDGATEVYTYTEDGLGLLRQETRGNGSESFTYGYEYDPKGRVSQLTYPSGFAIKYVYTDYDEVEEIHKADGGLVWKADETDPDNGLLQKATYGNGLQNTYSYDSEDRLSRIYVPGVIDFNYQYNNKQQLDWRNEKYYIADSAQWMGFKEEFTYDGSNRLLTATGGAPLTMVYAGNKIESKSDAGSYKYQSGNHRIDELTAMPGYRPPQHDLTFTDEGKVETITEKTDTATLKLFTFGYGLDNKRFSMEYKVNDTLKYTRYYFDNYEKEVLADGTVRHLNYIYAPNGLVAIYSDSMYYVYTDRLGSLRCITDSAGTVKQMLSFDAWGNRCNPLTGVQDSTIAANLLFARGFTGHEHLDEVGLINMNGRAYDPRLSMFISPDNYVQSPDFSQNFNRYSYCLNNPLMYNDPSGEIIFTVLAAIFCPPLLPVAIGADIGWITGGIRGAKTPGMTFWDGAWRGGVVGAVGGALSMVGGGPFVANVAWGMGQGALTGGLDALLWGNDVGKGMLYGAAFGGGLASLQSAYQSIRNYSDYGMFGTNDGVFNRMVNDAYSENLNSGTFSVNYGKAQKALNFWQDRFGGPNLNYTFNSNGTTSKTGDISIGKSSFAAGPDGVRCQIAHEMGHYINNVNWDNGVIGGTVSDPKFINVMGLYQNDGNYGYMWSVGYAGKYHIGYNYISKNVYYRPGSLLGVNTFNAFRETAWHNYFFEKWFRLLPLRFF